MTLLSIIFVLTIERYYRVLDEYRKLSWFTRWSLWVREHRELDSRLSGWVISLLTLLVPVLLVHQLAQWMADGGWLPELLFGMLILILSLGPTTAAVSLKKAKMNYAGQNGITAPSLSWRWISIILRRSTMHMATHWGTGS